MVRPLILDDLRREARRRLPRMVFDYLDGAAGDEAGLARNRAALDDILFAPRRMVDVSRRDTGVTLFGRTRPTPMIVAPTGLNGLLWPDGDVALARAAARAGVPFCLSTAATTTIEDVARRSDGERWFQLYVLQRDFADRLVERAAGAGYAALVVTVDVAVNGRRARDARNGFGVPLRPTPRTVLDVARHPGWLLRQWRHGFPELANMRVEGGAGLDAQAALMRRELDASFDWDDLAHIRDRWSGPLIVKGLSRPDDAERCRALGCDAVVLSNHGARQLASVPSPVEALAEMARTSGMPVLVDSGFRDGADVVKAMALGAGSVLVGRPLLYALASGGEERVVAALEALRADIDRTLALIGCPSVSGLDESVLVRPGPTDTPRSTP